MTLRMRDVHNVLSSTALLSSCRLVSMASSMESTHLIPSLLFLLPSISPQHYCLFQRTFPSHDVPKVGQLRFVTFASSDASDPICSRAHLSVCLVVHASAALSSNAMSQRINLIPISLLHCPNFSSAHSN